MSKVKEIFEKYEEFLESGEIFETTDKGNSDQDPSLARNCSGECQNTTVEEAKVTKMSSDCEKEKAKTKPLSPPKVIFAGPDVGNHEYIEGSLQKLLLRAKKQVLIGNYIIGNGILNYDVANILKKRCGKNFKIITDQMQMTNKNLKKYSDDLVQMGIKIKKNNNAKNFMHGKFMIIDKTWLVEGSMNMGEKSLKNYEHITVSQDRGCIQSFVKRFHEMWKNNLRFSDYTNDDIVPAKQAECESLISLD